MAGPYEPAGIGPPDLPYLVTPEAARTQAEKGGGNPDRGNRDQLRVRAKPPGEPPEAQRPCLRRGRGATSDRRAARAEPWRAGARTRPRSPSGHWSRRPP